MRLISLYIQSTSLRLVPEVNVIPLISYRCGAQVSPSYRLAMSYLSPTPTRVLRFHVGDPTFAKKAVSASNAFFVLQAPDVHGLPWS